MDSKSQEGQEWVLGWPVARGDDSDGAGGWFWKPANYTNIGGYLHPPSPTCISTIKTLVEGVLDEIPTETPSSA